MITEKLFNTCNGKWTIEDEAIHRGVNYAEYWERNVKDLLKEGMSLHAILKNAYQEGFLHGFEHKFDQHNYDRQTDMVSECPKPKEKKMEDIAHRLRKAYNLLYAMNNETTDMDGYFHGVEETLGYVAEALDMVEGRKDGNE